MYQPERDSHGNVAYFSVEIADPTIRAVSRLYAYGCEALALLFDEMAHDWRGWSGTKEWASLERELSLSCTADRKGHVDPAS